VRPQSKSSSAINALHFWQKCLCTTIVLPEP
jgi:hypothetical protein